MYLETGLQASKFSENLICVKRWCHDSIVLASDLVLLVQLATAALVAHLACSLSSKSYHSPA